MLQRVVPRQRFKVCPRLPLLGSKKQSLQKRSKAGLGSIYLVPFPFTPLPCCSSILAPPRPRMAKEAGGEGEGAGWSWGVR